MTHTEFIFNLKGKQNLHKEQHPTLVSEAVMQISSKTEPSVDPHIYAHLIFLNAVKALRERKKFQ